MVGPDCTGSAHTFQNGAAKFTLSPLLSYDLGDIWQTFEHFSADCTLRHLEGGSGGSDVQQRAGSYDRFCDNHRSTFSIDCPFRRA